MQNNDVNKLLKELINISSETGSEAKISEYLFNYLKKRAFNITRFPVQKGRVNILSQVGKPKIILQAHVDVVPPHIRASEDEKYIYGRGACDTKGSVASMIIAAQNALKSGITDFGLLFTVGEEIDFIGAKKAQALIEKLNAFIIVGEPTLLKPVVAHYGVLVISLSCYGKAAHSSQPSRGENAIDRLIALLNGPIKKLNIHQDTLMSLVKINGGIAENIIPDKAEAVLSFRIAPTDENDYHQQIKNLVGVHAMVQEIRKLPPICSKVPKSLKFLGKGKTVKYGTELTFFKNGLVLGPGNIMDAHTPNEKISKNELNTAVNIYSKILKLY